MRCNGMHQEAAATGSYWCGSYKGTFGFAMSSPAMGRGRGVRDFGAEFSLYRNESLSRKRAGVLPAHALGGNLRIAPPVSIAPHRNADLQSLRAHHNNRQECSR